MRRVATYDEKGRFKGLEDKGPIESNVEFHWIVYADSAEKATERVRAAGYFCGGLDSQFTCTAYEVAVLDAGRFAAVHGEQPGRDAVANAVEVRSHTAAVDESGSARILRLARKFREFVVQV